MTNDSSVKTSPVVADREVRQKGHWRIYIKDAQGFTLGVLKAVISVRASFNQLAMNMGLSEPKAMARQAVHQRVDQSAVAFMMGVTAQALKERWNDELLVVTKKFNRVLIEDSSQAQTASLLRKNFSSIPLSIEKIAHDLVSFVQTLVCPHRFADCNPDPRHLQMDKRSRESLQESTLPCLS